MKALAQYVSIYRSGNTIARWQNYYYNQTVELDDSEHEFAIFEVSGLETGDLQTEGTLQVSFAASNQTVPILVQALRNGFFVRVQTYAFDPRQGNDEPQEAQILVGSYTGQIVGAQRNTTSFIIELGATLSPVGSQVPPRKFTTRLIGTPCRLD